MTVWVITPNGRGLSGGVKVLEQIVKTCRKFGVDAELTSREGGINPWWCEPVEQVLWTEAIARSKPEDVVICGWNSLDDISLAFQMRAETKCYLALGIWQPEDMGMALIGEWVFRLPWTRFAGGTRRIAETFGADYGIAMPVLRHYVDCAIFRPGPKRRQAAIIQTYKSSRTMQEKIERCFPALPIIQIKESSEQETALVLSESEFFFWTSEGGPDSWDIHRKRRGRHEGYNLPCHEAMAAGCCVIGWQRGGAEYMTGENSYVVPDGDEEMFLSAIDRALRADNSAKVAAGLEWARSITEEVFFNSIMECIS